MYSIRSLNFIQSYFDHYFSLKNQTHDSTENNLMEIGSYQPENVFKDILILPKFNNFITSVYIIDNNRF